MRCVLSAHLNASEALASWQLRTSVIASDIGAASRFGRVGSIFGTVTTVVTVTMSQDQAPPRGINEVPAELRSEPALA